MRAAESRALGLEGGGGPPGASRREQPLPHSGFPRDTDSELLARDSGSVQLLRHVRLFATPRTAAHQASLSITSSWSLLKLLPTESVMPSNRLILCRPLLLPPSIFPSIRVSSNESTLRIGWPKYWSFSFSISASNDYSGLISFRMDWLDLLDYQGINLSCFKPLRLWKLVSQQQLETNRGGLPGSPVVRTPHSHSRGLSLDPWSERN